MSRVILDVDAGNEIFELLEPVVHEVVEILESEEEEEEEEEEEVEVEVESEDEVSSSDDEDSDYVDEEEEEDSEEEEVEVEVPPPTTWAPYPPNHVPYYSRHGGFQPYPQPQPLLPPVPHVPQEEDTGTLVDEDEDLAQEDASDTETLVDPEEVLPQPSLAPAPQLPPLQVPAPEDDFDLFPEEFDEWLQNCPGIFPEPSQGKGLWEASHMEEEESEEDLQMTKKFKF
jgi:hypothetical protein